MLSSDRHKPKVVNSRSLSSSSLQKLINNLFLNSTFSRHASSHLVAPVASPSKGSDKESSDHTKATRKSPKKSVERHAIFVLNLTAPPAMVDFSLEPEKRMVVFQVCASLCHFSSSHNLKNRDEKQDESRIFAFVEDVVKTFLRAQGFLTVLPAAPRRPPSVSPSKVYHSLHASDIGPHCKKPKIEDRPGTPHSTTAPPVLRALAYDFEPLGPVSRQRDFSIVNPPEIRVVPEVCLRSLRTAGPQLFLYDTERHFLPVSEQLEDI